MTVPDKLFPPQYLRLAISILQAVSFAEVKL